MDVDSLSLKVWRLHPSSCRVERAEKTLNSTAHRGGVRYCGPFTNANAAGWWLYPPVDVDITWRGGREFEYELLTPYDDVDYHLIRFLLDDDDRDHVDKWCTPGGRTKFTWGLLEEGVVQIWTGCIFATPPGWGLHIRSPVNVAPEPYHVMEAIIETDWLHYDVWVNVVFDRPNETVSLRRDSWPPLAQIVPVPHQTYDTRWRHDEETINRNSEEAAEVFDYFVQYNRKKFAGTGTVPIPESNPPATKDSSTYYKERKRRLKGDAA